MIYISEYKTDEYSDGNSMEAICSRGDLAKKPYTGGCIDTKISDYHMAMNMTSVAQSGPTYQVYMYMYACNAMLLLHVYTI